MILSRRHLIAGAATLATATGRAAHADTYPSKTIRMITGNVPGGSTDYVARLMAEALTTRLGQSVVVESRPGASTSIALTYISKAAPDGYILGIASSDGTAMLTAEKPVMPYDIRTDLSFICRASVQNFVIAIKPNEPFKTLPEMVAYAKANPGKLRYGSIGVGSSTHLGTLLLQQEAGIEMTHVPYKGGNAVLTDLLTGVIDLGLLTVLNVADYRETPDKLRVIAVTGSQREPQLPDVPNMAESGYPKVDVTSWLGLIGPPHLPPDVLARLQGAAREALAEPAMLDRMNRLALHPSPLTGDAFRDSVLAESEQWRRVVQSAHLVVNE